MWVTLPRESSIFRYLGEIFMKAIYSTKFKDNMQKLEDYIYNLGRTVTYAI